MAYASGTATDFIDFLRQVSYYVSGGAVPGDGLVSGAAVPAPDQWTVLTNGAGQPSLPGSGFATDGELYLQGSGSDPDDEIIVGVKTYRNVGANIFGWNLRGFTFFDDALDFDTMPGVSPSCFAAFDDATFDTWIWCNARRIMAAARIGTTDLLIHLGFIQQYGTRNQYPYPLLIGGSATDIAVSFQTNLFSQACLPDPCDNGAQLRWVDGTWQEYSNYYSASDQRALSRKSDGNCVWPSRNPNTNADGAMTNESREDTLFEAFNTGSGSYISNSEIDTYPIFPSVLMNGTALVGQIDGLMTMFGLGVNAGDTLTDSSTSPPTVYDVFKNTWRSEPLDMFAVKRV